MDMPLSSIPSAGPLLGSPERGPSYGFELLQLAAIVPSKTNPRTYFDPVALQALADSIKSIGIAAPILVRPLPPGWPEDAVWRDIPIPPTHEIIAGERRYRAATMAGLRQVPVLVRDMTDEAVLHMQLVENVQREDLHPLEEAQGYRAILDLPSQAATPMKERIAALAGEIKRSTRYIYQTLQLLQLCEFSRRVFLEGKLERTTALQVARIGNDAQQVEATKRIAGLAQHDGPMSQRAAEDYVNRTFMLALAKAPFPITVALAGAPACGECPKNSINAADLFAEGKPGPATCMDPSCYGKKNVAHSNQLAEAARKQGAVVISGKKAKEILPPSYIHNKAERLKGYACLDSERWDVIDKLQGKTLRQILGEDIPKPVLIANGEGGFFHCLTDAVALRLLKERNLINGRAVNDEYKAKQREANRKNEAEKAWRRAAAAQLVAKAGKLNAGHLLAKLLVPIALQVYGRLDHETSKRTRALMEWTELERAGWHSSRADKIGQHFAALSPEDLNRFFVAACVAGEMHVAEYYKPGSVSIDNLAQLLKVDVAAIKQAQKDADKAKAKAKADKVKGKGKPAKAPAPAKKLAPWDAAPAMAAAQAAKPRASIVDTTGDLLGAGLMNRVFLLNQWVRARPDVGGWGGRKGQVRSVEDTGYSVRFKGRNAGLVTLTAEQIEAVQ